MPQTREHVDILQLLNVRHSMIVISKVDCVDEELLQMAVEDVQSLVKGTVLERAPIIPFSATVSRASPLFL